MANSEAQIVRLAYSSRGEFAAATSSVPNDKPISALIYGETPMVVGYKVNGVYRYVEDQKAAVTAVLASITTLQNVDANLQAQISALQQQSSGGGTQQFGSMSAPPGAAFTFATDSGSGVRKPMTAVDFSLTSNPGQLEPFGVAYVKIAVNKMFSGDVPGDLYLGLFSDSPLYFGVFANSSDANSRISPLAGCEIPAGTPGIYPILDASDNETVWGWLYTKDGLTDPDDQSPIVVDSHRRDNAFGIPWSRVARGLRIRIPFKFYIGPYWGANIGFDLRTATWPYGPIAYFEFVATGYAGFVEGEILMEFIDDVAEGLSPTPLVRCWMELDAGAESVSPIVAYQPQMFEGEFSPTNPDEAIEFLCLSAYALDVSNPQFDLYSVQAILENPPDDLV